MRILRIESWTQDIALIWSDHMRFFGRPSQFGSTKDEVQKTSKKDIMTKESNYQQMPLEQHNFQQQLKSTLLTANKHRKFVNQNNLDGVDIDWEDNSAMGARTASNGSQHLLKLQEQIPDYIITHTPQGPYFKNDYYKNGGYVTIHKQVCNLRDFYNVQFYNQEDTKYSTCEQLLIYANRYFIATAVKQIIAKGIPAQKIIVGKSVTSADASNTGYMKPTVLWSAITQVYNQLKWYGCVMYWQYLSDLAGTAINNAVGHFKELCAKNKNCN